MNNQDEFAGRYDYGIDQYGGEMSPQQYEVHRLMQKAQEAQAAGDMEGARAYYAGAENAANALPQEQQQGMGQMLQDFDRTYMQEQKSMDDLGLAGVLTPEEQAHLEAERQRREWELQMQLAQGQ